MRRDHHVEIANWLTFSRQLVADLRVKFSCLGWPGECPRCIEKFANDEVQAIARRKPLQAVKEFGFGYG